MIPSMTRPVTPAERTRGRLINLSLANTSFTKLVAAKDEKERYHAKVRLKPLQATADEYDFTDKYVKALLYRPGVGSDVRNNPALRPKTVLVQAPAPGTTITDMQAMGSTYQTCKFVGSVEDGTRQVHPRELFHSVYQAQWLLMMMTDIARIEWYLTVDERPMVQAYGRDLLLYRKTNLERAVRGEDKLTGMAAIKQSSRTAFSVDF